MKSIGRDVIRMILLAIMVSTGMYFVLAVLLPFDLTLRSLFWPILALAETPVVIWHALIVPLYSKWLYILMSNRRKGCSMEYALNEANEQSRFVPPLAAQRYFNARGRQSYEYAVRLDAFMTRNDERYPDLT